MKKKILFIIIVLMFVYPSFCGINLGFKTSLNTHSNEIYKSLYGTISYGWGIGIGLSPYEGIEIMGLYGENYDKGYLSYTKEDISFSLRIISVELKIEPLSFLQDEYVFHISPYLSIEPSMNLYREKSVIRTSSGSKFTIAFGGGISIDIKDKNRFYVGIKYKNIKTFSEIHNQDINIGGLCFEAGLKIKIFD